MTSLSKNARVAGLIYLVSSLIAVVRLIYIPITLIVDNPAGTINKITTHELLFGFGIVSQLLTGASATQRIRAVPQGQQNRTHEWHHDQQDDLIRQV